MYGDTGRVDLYVRRVGKHCSLTIALDSCGTVTSHRIGGEEVGVAVSASCDNDSISRESLQLTCHEVLSDNATCAAIDNNKVFHLITCEELYLASLYLSTQRRVCTKQQLLTCLTLSIEGTAHLRTTERTVGKHAAILTCKRNSLCYALVDDVVADLCQTVNVGFTSTIVTTLHCVIEQTINGVTVILIVLCCIDTALCCDGVSTTRRVLNTEVQYVEAHLAERGCGAGTSQSCTHHDDVELQFVLRVHQSLMCFIVGPFLSYWSLGYL